MKTSMILCAMAFSAMVASAQTANGGLDAAQIKEITSRSGVDSPAQKALTTAIRMNPIDQLAKGEAQLKPVPSQFSVETKKQSIHNQKSSGRCWMFSGFNVLRSDFAAADTLGRVVEFSQGYLFVYDQLEKANLMLQGVIDTAKKPLTDQEVDFFFSHPISDGGTYCGVIDLVRKYGLVPMEVMPETYSAESTSRIDRLVASKLREYGLKLRKMVADGKKPAEVKKEKTDMLKTVYRMLTMAYGVPPVEFTYCHHDKDGKPVGEEKQYTPMSFAEEVGALKTLNDGYLMVMNDPRNPYHKVYEIEYDRHTYDGTNWRYLNLPMEEVEALAIEALKGGQKMYSSYDVGKFLDSKRGFASLENFDYASLFQTDFNMNKAERISTHDSGSTHAMTLAAVNLDANGKPTAWKVENSWGTDSGQKGCIVMTADWFREYMFRLVVPVKYASDSLMKEYRQKPVMLKYDDALFSDK